MIYNPAQSVTALLNDSPLVSPGDAVDSLDNNPS